MCPCLVPLGFNSTIAPGPFASPRRQPQTQPWRQMVAFDGGQMMRSTSRRARVEKMSSSQLASQVHFGTICVYRPEHPSLTHNFKCAFLPIFQQAESTQIRSRRKRKLFCASCRTCVSKRSIPASWPAKCHFGTICVHQQEHPSLTNNFKGALLPILQQAKSTQISSWRKGKLFCALRRARVLKKSVPASWPANQVPFWHNLRVSTSTRDTHFLFLGIHTGYTLWNLGIHL